MRTYALYSLISNDILPEIQSDARSLNQDTVALFPISLSYWRTNSANNVPNLLKQDSVEWVETVIQFFLQIPPRSSSRVTFFFASIFSHHFKVGDAVPIIMFNPLKSAWTDFVDKVEKVTSPGNRNCLDYER